MPGLGVVPGVVRRLRETLRVPHMGWNLVSPERPETLVRSGHAYFANSYGAFDAPDGWDAARTPHGAPFISAIERGPVVACQFHPELSGAYGMSLLERWLALACAPRQEARAC